MTRLLLLVFFACVALPARADVWVDRIGPGWTPLDGAAIRDALEGRRLAYQDQDATQAFRSSGRTLYTVGGRESWGYWRVEGDAYCSQWPPSDLWACYEVLRKNDRLRFVQTATEDIGGEAVYDD